MPPLRGAALIPLLTVLGTTAAAAVFASKYAPQYFANKHKDNKRRQSEDRDSAPNRTSSKMATQTSVQPPQPAAAAKKKAAPVPPPRSNEVVAVLLQDPYLVISAFGVCIMVVAVLVSLALVEMREDVASLNDLQMFGPLMLVAMGLISLGMVLSMANPKPKTPMVPLIEEVEQVMDHKTTSAEDAAALKKAAQEGDQGFLYNYYKNKYANEPTEVEVEGEDGQPTKRVSRCPFGFT
jgi:hypothetical protein